MGTMADYSNSDRAPARRRLCVVAASLGVTALCLALLLTPRPVLADDLQSIQVVGAIPIDAERRRESLLKDLAIQEALWQGVSRVANELLDEQSLDVRVNAGGEEDGADTSGEGEPKSQASQVRTALGKDMVQYTRSFRIIDDQGENPVMFTSDPNAATEYVVIVEVQVDSKRVAEGLRSAGLLIERSGDVLTGIELEVRGLMEYGGLTQLVEVIEGRGVGAETVSPREFQRGVARFHVRAEWGAEELLERLLAAAPPELDITPVSVTEAPSDGGGFGEMVPARSELIVTVRWTGPDPDADPNEAPASRRRR
jgi:hypothetical protein